MTTSKEFDEGFEAGNVFTVQANPYPGGSKQWSEWYRGFVYSESLALLKVTPVYGLAKQCSEVSRPDTAYIVRDIVKPSKNDETRI